MRDEMALARQSSTGACSQPSRAAAKTMSGTASTTRTLYAYRAPSKTRDWPRLRCGEWHQSSIFDELIELNDLLSYHIAHDARACLEAQSALEAFVSEHPDGIFIRVAEDALESIGKERECA